MQPLQVEYLQVVRLYTVPLLSDAYYTDSKTLVNRNIKIF
jgi:hypothetical protein